MPRDLFSESGIDPSADAAGQSAAGPRDLFAAAPSTALSVTTPDALQGFTNAVGRGLTVGQSDRLQALNRATGASRFPVLPPQGQGESSPEEESAYIDAIQNARANTQPTPTYGDALKQVRAENDAYRTQHPVASIVGETAGLLTSPVMGPLSAGAGKIAGLLGTEAGSAATAAAPAVRQSLANMALRGAVEGGTMGAGFSNASDVGGIAKDAGTGAVVGAVTSPLMGLIGRAINPQINPDAKYLIDAGVTPKPGQILGGAAKTLEEKAASLPIVGEAQASAQRKAIQEFNVAAYNEALAPIEQTFDGTSGHQGVEKVRDAISDVYDSAKSKISLDTKTLRTDPDFINDVANAAQLSTELTPDKQKQFANIIANKVGSRLSKPTIDGDAFKSIQTELGDKISSLRSRTASPDDHSLADALDAMLDAFQNGVARNSPDAAEELSSANAAWARYARIRRAASSVAADHGNFTPAQLYNAVRALDRSPGKGDFAMGKALMQPLAGAGKSVLGNTYPESGTAGRLFQGSLVGSLLRGGAEVATLPALVGGSLPYLPGGRQVAAALAGGQRPDLVIAAGRAVARAGLPATALGTAALVNNQ